MKFSSIITLSMLCVAMLAGCKKEAGTGGKASISGQVLHHSRPIPHAVVYIKYGASELPGTEASDFDDSFTADANAEYEITDLRKGDYYLYSIGFDEAIQEEVVGGIPVEIAEKKEELKANIPVTETGGHTQEHEHEH